MIPEPVKYSAKDIFLQAEAFFQTLSHMHKADPQSLSAMTVPLLVQTAFTCELMLKCLVMIEQNQPPKSHGLFDLYDKLKPERKASLSAEWDKKQETRREMLDNIDKQMGKKNPRDLPSNLKSANESFVLMRYIYEGGKDFDFFISDLPHILRLEIEKSSPEWFSKPQPPYPPATRA